MLGSLLMRFVMPTPLAMHMGQRVAPDAEVEVRLNSMLPTGSRPASRRGPHPSGYAKPQTVGAALPQRGLDLLDRVGLNATHTVGRAGHRVRKPHDEGLERV